MRTIFVIGWLLAAMLAGCATSGPPASPASPAPSMSPESSTSALPAASPAPASSSAEAASPTSSSAGSFTVCPTEVDGPVCHLPPGDYTAAVHDRFSFSIGEDGWQEERQQTTEFGTRMVLSRVDDPNLRLTFLSGSTGPTSPVDLGAAAIAPPGFTTGQLVDLMISGTQAQSLDLISAGAGASTTLTIEGASVSVDPSKSYRLTLAKIPMDQESAAMVLVTEAPADRFATFVPMADTVVKSLKL